DCRLPACPTGQLRRDVESIPLLPDADLRLIGKSCFPYLIDSLNPYLLESLKLTGFVLGLGMTKLRYSPFGVRYSKGEGAFRGISIEYSVRSIKTKTKLSFLSSREPSCGRQEFRLPPVTLDNSAGTRS